MPVLRPSHFITPRHVQLAARLMVIPVGVAIAVVYARGWSNMASAATSSYVLIIALLLAFPMVRSADLAMAAVLFLSAAEFGSAIGGPPVDFARWLCAMAALGTVIVPLKTQRIRALTIYSGWRPFADSERRRSRGRPSATVGSDIVANASPVKQVLLIDRPRATHPVTPEQPPVVPRR